MKPDILLGNFSIISGGMIYQPGLYDWTWVGILEEVNCAPDGVVDTFVQYCVGWIADTATANSDNECPHCHTQAGLPKWMARGTILWANQHGWCRRIFCSNCGGWHDVKSNGSIRQVHPPYELDPKRRKL